MEFRRPLGLVLPGAAAHGAWQTGVLDTISRRHGIEFDAVLGVSAGSLTGVAYALDRMDEICERWRNIDSHRIMRWRPRVSPPSLFAGDSIKEAVKYTEDEERAKERLRVPFTVISVCFDRREHIYARFTPGGEDGWSSPMSKYIVASCSIPCLFPPVKVWLDGERRRLIDGGAQTHGPVSFEALSHCKDIVVLEADPQKLYEDKPPPRTLKVIAPQRCRANPYLVDEGIQSLKGGEAEPRVFVFHPPEPLGASSLKFQSRYVLPWLERGLEDGETLLKSAEDYQV